jgi:hypothetical protein
MRFITRGFVAVAVIAAIGGCGGGQGGAGGGQGGAGGEEAAVRGVIADLQRLSRAGDAKQICSQIFSRELARSIKAASKSHSCVTEIKQKVATPAETLKVKKVQITGPTNATAIATEQTKKTLNLYLIKRGGDWQLRSVNPPLTRSATKRASKK